MPLDSKALAQATAAIIKEHVSPLLKRIEALEARPIPERGEKGDLGAPGETGQPGRDGVGVAGAVIDRSGVLVLTLTDGSTRELGEVVGKDGTDGRDGVDGTNGDQGPAGFGLDDFDCEPIDERTIKLMFTRGEVCHSFELEFPVIIDRGVFKAGGEYKRGDAVTWGGSLWIAQRDTGDKPDAAESGWRLAVKKGRDGKDAK